MPGNRPFAPAHYKAAVFDLDGTILHNGVLSEGNRQALGALAGTGIQIVLSTGRHYKMIPPEVLALPFLRYIVSSSGAHVMDRNGGRVLAFTAFEQPIALRLAEALLSHAAVVHIFCRERVLLPVRQVWAMRGRLVRAARGVGNRQKLDFLRWANLVVDPLGRVRNPGNPVAKINAYFEDEAACARLLKRLCTELPIEAVTTNGLDIEATPAGVNKATGLAELCKQLGIQPREAVMFGDSNNDLAAMRCCGYAVAMGNANAEVKAAADMIAPNVEEDGAAQALRRLFSLL